MKPSHETQHWHCPLWPCGLKNVGLSSWDVVTEVCVVAAQSVSRETYEEWQGCEGLRGWNRTDPPHHRDICQGMLKNFFHLSGK